MHLGCRVLTLISVLLISSSNPSAAAGQSQPVVSAPDSRAEIEHFLRTAKVTKSKLLDTGVTRPRKLTLTDGKVVRSGVFKTIDEHRPGMTQLTSGGEVDFKDSWKYEVAAYELDKILGIGMVPVTVEREVGRERGSLQIWIDDSMTEAERLKKKLFPPDTEAWNRAMFKVRVFDALIYNFDRDQNPGNLLVGPDWKLYMIDHTRSFKIFSELKSPGGLKRFSTSLMDALKKLDKATVKEKCGRYLTNPEVEAMFDRRDKILELHARLVAEKGPSITYP